MLARWLNYSKRLNLNKREMKLIISDGEFQAHLDYTEDECE